MCSVVSTNTRLKYGIILVNRLNSVKNVTLDDIELPEAEQRRICTHGALRCTVCVFYATEKVTLDHYPLFHIYHSRH